MPDGLDRILLVSGLSLSAVTMIVLGWMILNCWRRESLPAVSYGGMTIPTPLLAAMFAYLVLVVFWHPERRSARRLLLGKRAVRAEKRR